MPALARSVATFPTARLHPRSGALPVEVSLIAQLGHGAGDALFASATRRQQAHEHFVDELDEPSARLGAMDLAKGDASSLYSFAVGAKAAKPGVPVICLHGDGSFGQNAMELDTAVRHKLPLLCVISLNGRWTADPERNKPGRDLGYTR